MAEVTKPIALDETLHTTSSPSQNIADVLKGGLYDIAQAVSGGGGSSVSWTQIQNSGDKIAEITINGTTTDVYSPSVSSKADNSIIAPVLTTFQATATVKDSGTQFIYNGVLYEITTSVTAGTAFVVDTNVKVAKSVTENICFRPQKTFYADFNVNISSAFGTLYESSEIVINLYGDYRSKRVEWSAVTENYSVIPTAIITNTSLKVTLFRPTTASGVIGHIYVRVFD